MRKLLIVLTWVLGVAGFAALAYDFDGFRRSTAQVDGRDVAAWIYTPHVGPGGTLRGEIGAYAGLAIGIETARVRVAGVEAEVRGRGRHWTSSIHAKSTTTGEDDVEFAITLPADLEPGPVELTADVDFVVARRWMGGFENRRSQETLTLTLPIRSPAARVGMRALSGLRALVGFLALVWMYLRFGPGISAREAKRTESETEGLAYLMLCVAVFIALAGYPLFAQPLMAATDVTADALVIMAMLAWVFGPPFVALRIHRARPKTSAWRVTFADPTGRSAPDAITRTLGGGGLEVRTQRRGFTLRRDRRHFARVVFADRERIEAGATIEASADDLVFPIARALAEAGGALTLSTTMVQVPVARGATVEAIEAAHGAQVQAAVERLMASMKQMQSAMDGLMARTDRDR